MEAIEILMSEHRTILAAIEALTAFADAARRGVEDHAELGRFVRFIQSYADAHHHAKEEGVLFEAMIEAGFPRQAGPVGMMLHEHDLGRQYVAVLSALAGKAGPWTAEDREELDAAANGYAQLLRNHIHKEDAILYPMAEQRLSGALAFQVETGCAQMEARAAASGLRGELEALGRDLVARHVPGLGAERRAG